MIVKVDEKLTKLICYCRILIPNELVGAVIGKKGVVIRNITTECKARYR